MNDVDLFCFRELTLLSSAIVNARSFIEQRRVLMWNLNVNDDKYICSEFKLLKAKQFKREYY